MADGDENDDGGASTTTTTTPPSRPHGGGEAADDAAADAAAYHEAISAAVDLRDAHARNGCLSVTRSVRDVDANARRSLLYNIPLPAATSSVASATPPSFPPPTELHPKIRARIPSPSGRKLAVLVEEDLFSGGSAEKKKRRAFEIWTDGGHRLARRVPLPPETHGMVCADVDWFGGIRWSPDESALVYAAEVVGPGTRSFFDGDDDKPEESGSRPGKIAGGEYTLGLGKGEDWGEKYTSTSRLSLFVLNVDTGRIGEVHNVPGGREDGGGDGDGSTRATTARTTTGGGYVLGQPEFDPSGRSVAYTAWDAGGGGEMPRRLGAIYCYHRPCKIYASSVSGLLRRLAAKKDDDVAVEVTSGAGGDPPCVCVTPKDRLARSPRFYAPTPPTAEAMSSPSRLVYLCNTPGFDTHGGCMGLHACDYDIEDGNGGGGDGRPATSSRRIVVDAVSVPGERDGDRATVAGMRFPGLFLNQLPAQCFSPAGDRVFLTTQWGSITKIVSVRLEDGAVTPIRFDLRKSTASEGGDATHASQSLLCLADDGGAVVMQSEPHRPATVGYLPPSSLSPSSPDGGEGMTTKGGAPSALLAALPPVASTSFAPAPEGSPSSAGFGYRVIHADPADGGETAADDAPVRAILLLPDNPTRGEKLPLVVVPHGGPHSCMPTSYVPSYAYLCGRGRYAVLHVNFRGSTGFGQANVERLAGNAGSTDVRDVVAAAKAVVEMGVVDPERVGICGGSHGGFLAAHCIGQHPEIFKVACMRNPCTNIPTMATATDIPDWCYVETFGPGYYDFSNFRPPTRDELGAMWDISPVAHLDRVSAPTLVALGMRDRRVPPSQGIEYYHSLRAKGVPSKLLVYDDCDHAIDKVVSEADFWINCKRWFDEHL